MANLSDSPKEAIPGKEPGRKNKKLWRILLAVVCLAVVLALGLCAGYHAVLDHYLDQINIVTGEEELVFVTKPIEPEEESAFQQTQTEGQLPGTVEEPQTPVYNEEDLPLIGDTKDVINILLMATDSRGYDVGRSDTMILVSINSKTKKIVLCSFLRDIWAKYPQEPASPVSGGYDKLNHAHAYGGPTLTLAVLKETFNIDVKFYAKVDFTAFVKIVDLMGGLELELTADEAVYINNSVSGSELKKYYPDGDEKALAVQNGVQRINGKQALAHARNRTIGADWARTERQRIIISQMIAQVKGLSLSKLDTLLDTVLPLVTTNMSKEVLKELVGNAISYLGYEIVSTRVPQNGTYGSNSDYTYKIIPDLKVNCDALYETIYGKPPQEE